MPPQASYGARGASRRVANGWLGHVAALLLACLGFVGGTGLVLSVALGFGLDPGDLAFRLLSLAVAALCLLQFVIASNALSRRRLSARGEPHDLVDAFLSLSALEIALALIEAARSVLDWPLPQMPGWLSAAITAISFASLAALVLECGVLERASLTEIWRGRRRGRELGRHLRA